MKIIKEKINLKENNNIYSIEFINDNNFRFKFLNFGCYITNIIIPYKNKIQTEDVILGYQNIKNIFNDKDYFNCIVGRVAGRISNSIFYLKNKKYKLNKNEKKNHLHGGIKGFNKRIWKIKKLKKNNNSAQCILYYRSLHLEEGYPGNVNCFVKYEINNKNQITIEFKAKSDKDTIINLTNHNYWNFNGHNAYHKDISNHKVCIKANKFCETNKDLIPTGKISNLKGTKFDYLYLKKIGSRVLKEGGIDNYFIISKPKNTLKEIVKVYSPKTKMGMILSSNQPGIQFYTGNNMKLKYNGKNHLNYGKYFGLCFEPQKYPNAINTNNFPSVLLKKGSVYKSKIIFCLKNNIN